MPAFQNTCFRGCVPTADTDTYCTVLSSSPRLRSRHQTRAAGREGSDLHFAGSTGIYMSFALLIGITWLTGGAGCGWWRSRWVIS